MLEQCEQYFKEMQADMDQCRNKNYTSEKQVEYCHSIVECYWIRVLSLIADYEFLSVREEIRFNKEIKAKFLAEKEYYSLLYHAALFKPELSIAEEQDFWLRESKRLEKFIQENEEFYNYIKAGKTHFDKIFFTGEDAGAESVFEASHSKLLAMIMALERYDQFVSQALKMVGK